VVAEVLVALQELVVADTARRPFASRVKMPASGPSSSAISASEVVAGAGRVLDAEVVRVVVMERLGLDQR
jgi:hypothetical protein